LNVHNYFIFLTFIWFTLQLYEMVNSNVTAFRMAISGYASCDGLSDMLSHLQPMIHESNSESMLLLFNRVQHNALPANTSTTSTNESIESVAKRYDRREYILQNFGNQPNPFWRTKRAIVQGSGRR